MREKAEALRALANVTRHAESIRSNVEAGRPSTSEARWLAAAASAVVERVAALTALAQAAPLIKED